MALPDGVETVTVTSGRPLTLPDGTPFAGRLVFVGPDLVTIAGEDVVLGGQVSVPLVDGAFSVTLCATDATGMNPIGWPYTLITRFTNAPNWVRSVSLPKAAPAVVLADIISADSDVPQFEGLVPLAVIEAYVDAGDAETLATARAYADEHAGTAGALLSANDLSDLHSALTARAHLGLGTAATADAADFDEAGAAAGAEDEAVTVAAQDAADRVLAHVDAPDPHGDRAVAAEALDEHAAATTEVHGIEDTAALVLTNDSRLTDARPPTRHAASHATDGSDPVTPAEIGAAAVAGDLGGTPDAPHVTGTHLTDPLSTEQGGTGAASAAAALTAYAAVPGRNALTGMWHATAYGAAGDYLTDDTVAINAAVAACSAAGGGRVKIERHLVSGTGIQCKDRVTLVGTRDYSIIKNSGNNLAISSGASGLSDIGFEHFTIEGGVTSTVTVPTRTRASVAGTTMGIWLSGDLDPTASGAPVIRNVHMSGVTVRNTVSLPIRFFGLRGRIHVEDCYFYNTQDVGFAYCENVELIGCHSYMSADNGFSISRMNRKIVCVGNTVENCAYDGIWLSGYVGYAGPADFACTGNVVRGAGQAGIRLQDAPTTGVITGNVIDKMGYRGDASAPTDEPPVGILIQGNSATPGSPGTSLAYGLRIADNVIRNAPRAGIMFDGMQFCIIENNSILDCGSQFLADGVTAITASYTSTNVGILCPYPATLIASIVRNNLIADGRATPYCNWGVYPAQISGVQMSGNTMAGCRNASNLPAVLDAHNDGRLDGGQETVPRWAANNTSSITMSSGVVRFAYFTARRTATVTALRVNSGSTVAGATPSLVRFGLYAVDSNGNLTLLAATVSDPTVFATALTPYSRNLATAQTLVAGQQYAIGVIVVTAAAAPTIVGVLAASGGENLFAPTLCATLTGQPDLPATVPAGSLASTQSLPYAVAVGD